MLTLHAIEFASSIQTNPVGGVLSYPSILWRKMNLGKLSKDFFLDVHYAHPGERSKVMDAYGEKNVIVYSALEPGIGSGAFSKLVEGFLCALPDAHYKRLETYQSKETTCISFCLAGTHLGDHLYGIEPTERKIAFNAICMMTFNQQQKMQKFQFQVDFVDLFQQLHLPDEVGMQLVMQLSKSEREVLEHAFYKLGLSPIETLCLGYMYAGLSKEAIARRLGLYKANIDACFEKIRYCLKCRNNAEVFEYLDSIFYQPILKEYSRKLFL